MAVLTKKIFIILAVLIVAGLLITGWVLEREPAPTQDAVSEKQALQVKMNQKFDTFIDARAQMVLFACTQNLAKYQGITLKESFQQKEKQAAINLNSSQKTLTETLNLVKARFGSSVGEAVDEAFQTMEHSPEINASNVSRGYCQSYKKGFADEILNNLKQYQVSPFSSDDAPSQNNAIYLNSRFQVTKMTNNLANQDEPDTLFVGSKPYSVRCVYENVPAYDEAISVDNPIRSTAYKASEYFYQRYTPQINYILACQADTNLSPDKPSIQVSDTYPWYQPTATGSKNENAAGDVLSYIDKDQVIIVLGHEPCACNGQTTTQCNKLKETSRGYKQHLWPVISSLQEALPKYPLKAQEDITGFTAWSKNEIQKDFCFIDRPEVMSRLAIMERAMKKDVPEGWKFPEDK